MKTTTITLCETDPFAKDNIEAREELINTISDLSAQQQNEIKHTYAHMHGKYYLLLIVRSLTAKLIYR